MSGSRLSFLKKSWFLFRLWSLDVVTGSLTIGYYLTRIFEVNMPWWWWFVLGGSVWVMYTVDHLLDGFKLKNIASTAIFRHYYHARKKKTLSFLVLTVSSLILLIVTRYAPSVLIKRGFYLLGFIAFYFALIHYTGNRTRLFLFQKELAIAVIYVAGIALGPVTYIKKTPETWQIILVAALILIGWAEGVMASWFDYDNDLHDGNRSFTTTFGLENTRYFLIALIVMTFILIKMNMLFITNKEQFLFTMTEALMNLVILLLLLNPEKFRKQDRYRIIGEMIFWIPALLLLF
jgi:hypothetical protein